MENERIEKWQIIENMTVDILALAKKDQWEELPALELERRQLLEAFFKEPVSEELAPTLAEGILRIQTLDSQLIELAEINRKNISSNLLEMAKGKLVTEAYSKNI